MAKGPVLKPVFKAYHQRQAMLLLPILDELIAPKHPVRVVDEVLGKINIQPLINCYVSSGAAGYHLAILLKVMVPRKAGSIIFTASVK